jgi:hypothetical protein
MSCLCGSNQSRKIKNIDLMIEDLDNKMENIAKNNIDDMAEKIRGIMRYKVHLLEEKINIVEGNMSLKMDILMNMVSQLNNKIDVIIENKKE